MLRLRLRLRLGAKASGKAKKGNVVQRSFTHTLHSHFSRSPKPQANAFNNKQLGNASRNMKTKTKNTSLKINWVSFFIEIPK